MPKVSEFFGISIYFYFSDHPPPHFHAFYGGSEATIEIETLETLDGGLPRRAHALVIEWALQHRDELRRAWQQASAPRPVDPIEPLS